MSCPKQSAYKLQFLGWDIFTNSRLQRVCHSSGIICKFINVTDKSQYFVPNQSAALILQNSSLRLYVSCISTPSDHDNFDNSDWRMLVLIFGP